MARVIRRIDHLVAVVEEFDLVAGLFEKLGCRLVWDGRSRQHRSRCFSLGSLNIELLSREAVEGWPPLAALVERGGRRYGLQAAALDPGDLDATRAELIALGLDPSEPREGRLEPASGGAEVRWRNVTVNGLLGLLPGLPSFLCQFTTPLPTVADPRSNPVRLVELRVGLADPLAALPRYERLFALSAREEGDGFLLPLAATPVRLRRGEGLAARLEATDDAKNADLVGLVPGLEWV